jgi:hypothetical protein
MVFCTLTTDSLKALYQAVYKQQMNDKSPESIVKVVFDTLYDSSSPNEGVVASFVKEVPTFMQLTMKHDSAINTKYEQQLPQIKSLENQFQTYNDVIKYLKDAKLLSKSREELMKEDIAPYVDLFPFNYRDPLMGNLLQSNPEEVLKEIAQQANNIGADNTYNTSTPARKFDAKVKEIADKYFPEYSKMAQEVTDLKKIEDKQKQDLDKPTEEKNMLLTGDDDITKLSFHSIFGTPIQGNVNIISEFVDRARRQGWFIFPTENPREYEMDGSAIKEEDGVLLLKTISDQPLRRQHNIINFLSKEYEKDPKSLNKYKLKLQIRNEENKDWYYANEKNSNAIIAVLTNADGSQILFDKEGAVSSTGFPFAIQYDDEFYSGEKLNLSRNSLAKDSIPQNITPNFNGDVSPISVVYALLKANKPVYASISTIMAGTLSSYNSNNSYGREKKTSYKNRTLKQLIDEGVINWQLVDVKIDGFWMGSPKGIWESPSFVTRNSLQQVKVGKPSVYDNKSQLYIPLIGRKLKDVTFKGEKIPKESRLYQIIDKLDKFGEISFNTPDEEGNRIVASESELIDTYAFLKEILYRGLFKISFDGTTIYLNRNKGGEFTESSLKANSIWDAEINYVKSHTDFINLPLAYNTEEGFGKSVSLNYQDFIHENFETGVAPVKVDNSTTEIRKVNKRLIIKLDRNYKELKSELYAGTKQPETISLIKEGDKYSPTKKLEDTYYVTGIEDDVILLRLKDSDEDIRVQRTRLADPKHWMKIEKIVIPEKPSATEAQNIAIQNVRRLTSFNLRERKHRVTGLANPFKGTETSSSPQFSNSTIAGSTIDHIAKSIFSGKDVKFSEDVELQPGVSKSMASLFLDEKSFNETVKRIEQIKNGLEQEGYQFVTGVRVSDGETFTSGETDLLLINKEGVITVADFKTTYNTFNDGYIATVNNKITNKQYFATQGYLYKLLLQKNGLKVSNSIKIIGMGLVFEGNKDLPLETTKIHSIRDNEKFVFDFTTDDVIDIYKGKSLPDVIAAYEKAQADNSSSSTSSKWKRRDIGPLERSIDVIKGIAASDEVLMNEISEMERMLGENLVVNWVNEYNNHRYGFWDVKGITLYKNTVEGTVYHEGWHHFSQLFLTPSQKSNLYSSLREYGSTDLEVEEFLAEQFVKYVKDPGTYTFPVKQKEKGIISLFKRMWTLLKNWFTGTKSPTELFKALYTGDISNFRKNRSAENAFWGKLNSSILNEMGAEIINGARTSLYINTASWFIFKELTDPKNNLSLTWLRENSKSDTVKDMIYNGFFDKIKDRLSKLAVPADMEAAVSAIINNPEKVIEDSITQKGINSNTAKKYVIQVQEMSQIISESEDDGGFKSFIDFYFKNPTIESLRDETENTISDYIDPEASAFVSEDEEDESDAEFADEENKGVESSGEQYKDGPNDKSAFVKATQEIRDFFSIMPIVTSKNNDGTYNYKLNELDEPEIHDYANIFAKVKFHLANQNTLEEIEETLSNSLLQRELPQLAYIYDRLQQYKNKNNTYNFSFIQKFIKVMTLPEVDNQEVVIDFTAVSGDIQNEANRQKTAVRMNSISKIGENKQYRQWQAAFKMPKEYRMGTKVDGTITVASIFTNTSKDNIIYNVGGSIYLNPFYDYAGVRTRMSTKEFLSLMGVTPNDLFWENSDAVQFAERFASLLVYDLDQYKNVARRLLYKQSGDSLDNVQKVINSTSTDVGIIEDGIIKKLFISNPLEKFRMRRTYAAQNQEEATIETKSLIKSGEDLARANSIYSLEAYATSFVTGDGKTKWSSYEKSLIAYRTHMLNKIMNLSEFDANPLEYSFVNPNLSPWMRKTLFYKRCFQDGKRARIMSSVHDTESNQFVKIEMADLSSQTIVTEGKWEQVHPKSLSAQNKLFFDIVTLFTGGWLEIPRAATSSTILSLKLNTYGAVAQGQGFRNQLVPADFSSVSISSFQGNMMINLSDRVTSIIRDYVSGELQKLKWYFDRNPDNKFANELNVFQEIIPAELRDRLITQVKNLKKSDINKLADSIDNIVDENRDELNLAFKSYFSGQLNLLYDGADNSNVMRMSANQKRVLRNLTNLYDNRQRLNTEEEMIREEKIADTLSAKNQSSTFQSAVEKRAKGADATLGGVVAVFLMNQFILNVEYHSWYVGDNYQFANPFKRYNLATNTGILGIVSDYTNSMLNLHAGERLHDIVLNKAPEAKDYRKVKSYVVKDLEIESRNLPIMINDLISYELENKLFEAQSLDDRKARLMDMLSPMKKGKRGGYSAINVADGQSKISLDAYRTFRRIFGTWDTKKDEREYQRQLALVRVHLLKLGKYKYIGSNTLEKDEQLIKDGPYSTFNSQKWSYTGPELILDKEGNPIPGPMRTLFDKTSFQPLIPEMLLGTGVQDEELMFDLAAQDGDYVKFESASKGAKHSDIIEYFNINGVPEGAKLENVDPQWLISSYTKNQLSTDGETKTENTLGSQQRVELFDIKYLPEIRNNKTELAKITAIEDRYLDAIDNILQYHKAGLLNKYGVEEYTEGGATKYRISDRDRFVAGINNIAKNNNFPTNMREYINSGGDPSLIFNRKVLLDAIGGEIDRELRRLKVKGSAGIQVSSAGTIRHPYTNPTEDQVKEFGTNGLHNYHYIRDNKGKIERVSTMGVKITIQGDFKNLYNLLWKDKKIGNLETLNKAIKDKTWKAEHLDKLIFHGYRIPTNNNNFIDNCEIMEFLPESTGNIVIAPPEHIIKSGSDFDVDKMNFVFPSITSTGDLAELPYEDIEVSPAKYEKQADKTVQIATAQYKRVILTVEDLYKRINQITNSVKDYKENQKFIKGAVKKGKAILDKVANKRERLKLKLEQSFFEEDRIALLGHKTAGKTIYEIIEYFKPFFVDNAAVLSDINSFYKAGDILRDNNISEVNSKVDREFSKILFDLGKYKDYYTNQMLKASRDVLEHPAYLQMLVSPSNADYLISQAERIGQLTGRVVNDNLPSTQNSSAIVVNKKHGEYLGDFRGALGTYSIQRRWYSLFNFSQMEINREWSYQGKHATRIWMPLINPADRLKIGDENVVRLHGENIDGIVPRDIWDQFMTLTIDLPSNSVYTQFGINNHNKKIVQYLIASRYSVATVLNFINQPILREIYSRMEGNSSLLNLSYLAESKNIKNYTAKHAMLEVASRVGLSTNRQGVQNLQDLYDQAFILNEVTGAVETANEFVQHPGIFSKSLLNESDYFSDTQMVADMTYFNKNDEEFMERQKKILGYFMSVSLEANNFSSFQFAFSEDRNKNTNYYTILEGEANKRLIRGNEDDMDSPDSSMFSKRAVKKLEKRSIYSIFNYSKVAKLFYQEYAKEFTKFDIETSFMKLLKDTNTFGINRQLLATRIEGDFIEFIYKNFGEFKIKLYDVFSDKMSNSSERFSDYFMQNIFNVRKDENFVTYGSKLVKLLERYPELSEIEFIKRLTPFGIPEIEDPSSKNPNPLDSFSAEVIRFSRSAENTVAERNFYSNQFENLIRFTPEEFKITKDYSTEDILKISSFFTELAYLTLYQSGPTNIADNFSDLVPNSIWKPFSEKAFENYNRSVKDGKIKITDMMKMFNMMYIENNRKVPWRNKTMIYHLSYFQKQITSQTDRAAVKPFRKYISFFNNFTAGKAYDMKLFERRNDFNVVKDIYC